MKRIAIAPLTLACLVAAVAPAQAGSLGGIVAVAGRPTAGAVVYLEGEGGPAAPPSPAVMDQRNLEFVPKVLPVVRGTTVQFKNSDDIQHNVFSPSAVSGTFDLGTYGPGDLKTLTLNEPGEVVVLCNIHMEMEARIVVLPQPYFALSDTAGRYRIVGVPAGSYTVKVWSGHFLKDAKTIVVPADGELTVDLRVGE